MSDSGEVTWVVQRETHLVFCKSHFVQYMAGLQKGRGKVIGEHLKRIRMIYGYKASELSASLGISPSYLSEIENNKKQPSLEILKKSAAIYGIKLSSLILLSENLEEAEKENEATSLIRNMMSQLISNMSRKAEDPDKDD